MRVLNLFIVVVTVLCFTSCGNSSDSAATFCDTACKTDSLNFKGDNKLNPIVAMRLNACKADTLMWTHDLVGSKMLSLRDDIGQDVFLNKTAVDCYIKDTSYAWLQFNDCKTGRGFLYKLPFNKSSELLKIKGAFTRFDPKFSIDPDLAVYTDRGSVFVENMKTGQRASLSFDKQYKDLNFNKLHETVDSVHVTKDRIFVQMLRDGNKKPYEKKVTL